MNNTAIIILAAGNSSRFGSTKQLLHFNNKSLLQHVIDEAIESGAGPVIIVTGANAEGIEKSITQGNFNIVHNENWEEGMASGIVAGVKQAISLNNHVERIIIAVCDQPFVSASLFKQLHETHAKSLKNIIASSYADTIGTPALFTQKYFDALMSLQGEEGAKKILKANAEDVAVIEFPEGAIDIDTKEDYNKLVSDHGEIIWPFSSA